MWHTNCVATGRSIYNPTRIRCAVVGFGASSLLCIFYFLVSLGGFLSFGDEMRHADSITEMYKDDDWLFVCVRLALSTALLVAIPVNFYPARESCMVLVKKFNPNYQGTFAQHVLLGLILNIIIIVTAIIFPKASTIIRFLGGFLANLLMLVFPAIIGKKVFRHGLWLGLLVIVTIFSIFVALAAFDLIGSPVTIS